MRWHENFVANLTPGFPSEDLVQDSWIDLVLTGNGSNLGNTQCTPGYYNNEGQGYGDLEKYSAGHPGGAMAFFNHIADWRKSGEFDGLEFG